MHLTIAFHHFHTIIAVSLSLLSLSSAFPGDSCSNCKSVDHGGKPHLVPRSHKPARDCTTCDTSTLDTTRLANPCTGRLLCSGKFPLNSIISLAPSTYTVQKPEMPRPSRIQISFSLESTLRLILTCVTKFASIHRYSLLGRQLFVKSFLKGHEQNNAAAGNGHDLLAPFTKLPDFIQILMWRREFTNCLDHVHRLHRRGCAKRICCIRIQHREI